ncbi:MAG: hypothetical protein KJ069_30865 [Anaerolineae bacterium]|nr:hypothetical protein [Anaerolineae bacterium]
MDEVRIFVRAASHLPGITRIALIGSLTTDKVDPKDADMLVTVTDQADWTPLAMSGRKLQGHCQGFGRSGEVFLADEQHHYLGRTCSWKQCGPAVVARVPMPEDPATGAFPDPIPATGYHDGHNTRHLFRPHGRPLFGA